MSLLFSELPFENKKSPPKWWALEMKAGTTYFTIFFVTM
jgi:hypothetical protein